ncbi:MAG: hypothetical protein ABSH04_00255 [Acidimicrobiales bacterium]
MTVSQHHSHYGSIKDQRAMAFDRVRRAFRWTTVGAVTAVALIVGAVAHQIPGRSSSSVAATNGSPAATAPAPAASTTSGSSSTSGSSGSSGGAITQPTTAPAPSRRTPTAVSGGTSW